MLRRNNLIHEGGKDKEKGQSTVEYLVLVGIVIGVVIVFLASGNSPFKTALNSVLNSATNSMINMADRLAASYP